MWRKFFTGFKKFIHWFAFRGYERAIDMCIEAKKKEKQN